jgi:hypothetical protein
LPKKNGSLSVKKVTSHSKTFSWIKETKWRRYQKTWLLNSWWSLLKITSKRGHW